MRFGSQSEPIVERVVEALLMLISVEKVVDAANRLWPEKVLLSVSSVEDAELPPEPEIPSDDVDVSVYPPLALPTNSWP